MSQHIHNSIKALFTVLSSSDIHEILEKGDYVYTPKKKHIIRAGTLDYKVIFLLDGMIRGFFINELGEEKNIFLRPAGTVTGAPECLFNDKPTKYSFEAMPESKYITIERQHLERLMESNPVFADIWVSALQEIILTLISRVESLIAKTPEQRYQDLIVKRPSFFQKAYNKHIANYLGMTSVSLSRIIKRNSQKRN